MRRQLQQNYTFTPGTASVGTIAFNDYLSIDQSKILGITNATRNQIIYNPNSSTLGGTVSGKTLTLAITTATHSSSDKLIIAYESGDTKNSVQTSVLSEVSYVNVASGGSGYTSVPTVAFTGNTSSVTPTATVIMSNGVTGSVVGILITNVGTSTVAPTGATLSGGGFTVAATLSTPISGQSNKQFVDGESTAFINYYGTWAGTNVFEGSVDGYNFFAINGFNATTGAIIANTTSNITVQIDIAGLKYIQTRLSAFTSGVIQNAIRLSNGVSGISLDNPLPTGTNSIGNIGTTATVTTVATLANGQTAHSSASTGSPLRIGGRIVATSAATQDQTLVAGDAADVGITTGQQLMIKPFATSENDWNFACTAPVANTTDVVVKAASGTAGIRNYITGLSITNSSATTATEVVMKDGATVIWRGFVGANTLGNSVVGITFFTPLKGTANTAINFACITTASSVYVNAQGYTSV